MLLMGEYHHQIDEKSRIRIPAKLKDALGESPVILKGTDGCLFVYSQEAMNNMFNTKFANNDFTQADKTKALRLLTSSTVMTEEDKQGRILLPQNLIKHAGIIKNIVTIGAFDRVEIWSEERWNAYANLDSDSYDACLKKIASKED
jgi:MraZ protein